MYRYDEFDSQIVNERVEQFRGQVARRLDGSLTEEEFRPLRLMNGLYLQLHAYMLRIAIPYGTLSSRQMRQLAHIAETYDRGYGHFTTRQNIQFNWPQLKDVPDLLQDLADVEMHAIQTSGNCIRNITADPWAGVAADEIADPRPTAELMRQWSTLHPEFSFLPRKFKIAITGAPNDRAAVFFHDIGLRMVRNDAGEPGYEVLVGGGQGRTPVIAKQIRAFLPQDRLLPYLEAIMRIYNLYGRRDNKYKARIKILVNEEGIDKIREEVEAEYATIDDVNIKVAPEELARIEAYFAPPAYADLPARSESFEAEKSKNAAFARWAEASLATHKVPGYAIVNIPLKRIGGEPGDATADEMRLIADLADRYSFGEVRVAHEQNLVLTDVKQDDLPALWAALADADLATPNFGLITDIISCPGLDYCALATARSIPIAKQISERFRDPERQKKIGKLAIKISGCINACGHHHVGHIGILGLEKAGQESYQITLGGDPTETASIGERAGPGLTADQVVDAVEKLTERYLSLRETPDETFIEAYRRIGPEPFKEAVYAAH